METNTGIKSNLVVTKGKEVGWQTMGMGLTDTNYYQYI